jgi:hypothetical protein
MRRGHLLLLAVLGAVANLPAADAVAPAWDRITVAPMKTSIYVGSVTLTPGIFARHGDAYTTTYAATVWPWFFWGETGTVTIKVTANDVARAARGETVEFAGAGANQKGRPRQVSGRVQPADGTSGKLKIRIKVDGIELVFNGTYRAGEK